LGLSTKLMQIPYCNRFLLGFLFHWEYQTLYKHLVSPRLSRREVFNYSIIGFAQFYSPWTRFSNCLLEVNTLNKARISRRCSASSRVWGVVTFNKPLTDV